jgi:hypothetical protein
MNLWDSSARNIDRGFNDSVFVPSRERDCPGKSNLDRECTSSKTGRKNARRGWNGQQKMDEVLH